MKTLFSLLLLAVILIVCVASAYLYLEYEFLLSYMLMIIWIISLTFWIKYHNIFLGRRRARSTRMR